MCSINKNDFRKEFQKFSIENELFVDVKFVITAVSGGVDSMVMLSQLNEIKDDIGFQIVIAHFNHLYRGELSDNDELLVKEYCDKQGLKFEVERYDVLKYAKDNKISFEMAGRKLRYKFFNKLAKKYENSKIATAHILSDNSETLLLRIIKGTGLNGLQGIQPKTNNLIRPLLFAPKNDLYNFAKNNNIPFNDDHTNFENDCQRNIIRNQILPLISEINPQVDQSLKKLSKIASDQLELSRQIAVEEFQNLIITNKGYMIELNLRKLLNLISPIRNEIIFSAIRHIDIEKINHPPFHYLEKVNNLLKNSKTGSFIRIFDNIIFLLNRDKVCICNENFLNWKESDIVPGKIYERVSFIFSSEFVKFGNFSDINNSSELIDADKVKGRLKLRHWKEGDKFVPFGNNFSKKLSDYFIDAKVSRFEKQHVPILEDEEKIVWICGLRLSNEVRVSDTTNKLLKLEYKEF